MALIGPAVHQAKRMASEAEAVAAIRPSRPLQGGLTMLLQPVKLLKLRQRQACWNWMPLLAMVDQSFSTTSGRVRGFLGH